MEKGEKSRTGITPFDSFSTAINVLFGTGPILLPPTIAAAGIGLGSIWIVLIAIISIMGAEFVIETLSIVNAIKYFGQKDYNDRESSEVPLTMSVARLKDYFDMKETIEYGGMGRFLWGKKGGIFAALNIIIYLYGVLISKGIMVGNTMILFFGDIIILNNYYFWVILFFSISGALSFKDVASIAIVQRGIALFRYLTLILMVVGSTIIIAREGFYDAPLFNFEEFPTLFGTSIFGFLMHHSIPQMFRPVTPQSAIRKVLYSVFTFAGIVLIIVPVLGAVAFPTLSKYCYFNTVFDQYPVKFSYYIISTYVFLNVAALPVLTITIRTNMMKMWVPHLLPANSFEVTKGTFFFTILIIGPTMFLALVLKDFIHVVVDFIGGVCGVIIMAILPSLMVVAARRKCPLDPKSNPYRSMFSSNLFPWFLAIAGILVIPYNLYLDTISVIAQINGTKEICYKEFKG